MILTIGMILAAVAGYFVGRLVARIGLHNEREKAFMEGWKKGQANFIHDTSSYSPPSYAYHPFSLPQGPATPKPDTESSDQS